MTNDLILEFETRLPALAAIGSLRIAVACQGCHGRAALWSGLVLGVSEVHVGVGCRHRTGVM